MADKVKLFLAILIAVVAVGGFYYFDQYATLMRVGGMLALLAVGTVVAYQTAVGKATWAFVQESQVEVRKVVWPTKEETLKTTGLVVVMVVIIALLLWGMDALLGLAVRFLTEQGA